MNLAIGILTWTSGFFMGLGFFLLYPLLEPNLLLIGVICLVVTTCLMARKREGGEQ